MHNSPKNTAKKQADMTPMRSKKTTNSASSSATKKPSKKTERPFDGI